MLTNRSMYSNWFTFLHPMPNYLAIAVLRLNDEVEKKKLRARVEILIADERRHYLHLKVRSSLTCLWKDMMNQEVEAN